MEKNKAFDGLFGDVEDDKKPLTRIEKWLIILCASGITSIFVSSNPVECVMSVARLIGIAR